jgi:WhiB family redox-sensing transcriptional regulator
MTAALYDQDAVARLLGAIAGGNVRWTRAAACARYSPLVIDAAFHADYADGRDADRWADLARPICHRCPVQPQCLAWALGDAPGAPPAGEPRSVWAGLTPAERAEVRRARTRPGQQQPQQPAQQRRVA